MFDHDKAVAALAAALDDPKRSLIGDRRKGVYKVSLITDEMKEAREFARQLTAIGISPMTSLTHDRFGSPHTASVNVYTAKAQKRLLNATHSELSEPRRHALIDLVQARGPIPDNILENIWKSHTAGRTPFQIASRMNELDVMPGRGGKNWTATKVQRALAEFKQRNGQLEEAA